VALVRLVVILPFLILANSIRNAKEDDETRGQHEQEGDEGAVIVKIMLHRASFSSFS